MVFSVFTSTSMFSKKEVAEDFLITVKEVSDIISTYSTDLEKIASNCPSKDVFRTKLGDIKQIQNLDFLGLNDILAELIGAEAYKILNNQYFCKPPNYKMTSAHPLSLVILD